MTAIVTNLQNLERQHPEWQPWLAVMREILDESANPVWDAMVPLRREPPQNKVPLLTGVTVALEESLVRGLFERLILSACRSGTPRMATLESALGAPLDVLILFGDSLCQDGERLRKSAASFGADAEAFQAVATLVAVPFLHACNRQGARSIPQGWVEGYCPICGAWPALAEVRGVERSRYLRCGRCGGEWQTHCLFCPYCGMTDHDELVSLLPEKNGANAVIDACRRCSGYVKTFTTLQGSPPAKIMLDDLASAVLDVAALEQGYRRPQGAGYALNVTVTDNGAGQRRVASKP